MSVSLVLAPGRKREAVYLTEVLWVPTERTTSNSRDHVNYRAFFIRLWVADNLSTSHLGVHLDPGYASLQSSRPWGPGHGQGFRAVYGLQVHESPSSHPSITHEPRATDLLRAIKMPSSGATWARLARTSLSIEPRLFPKHPSEQILHLGSEMWELFNLCCGDWFWMFCYLRAIKGLRPVFFVVVVILYPWKSPQSVLIKQELFMWEVHFWPGLGMRHMTGIAKCH